ncbi:MAG: HAD family hydrolase [Anaerolineae bacterium]
MPFSRRQIQAVVFDYGSTLIEFGRDQIQYCDTALANVLTDLFGPLEFARMSALRDLDRRAPYSGDLLENDLPSISAGLVRQLYGVEPDSEQLARILQVRFQSFVKTIEAPDYLIEFLSELREHYKLGVLSNYPDGEAIRASLRKLELDSLFDAVVVSGDVGHVKPHEITFRTVLERLNTAPSQALYVGDNWFGDIQGSKRAGMQAAWITQWDTPEKFDRQEGDLEPDLVIEHLTDLRRYLIGPEETDCDGDQA